MIYPAAAVSRKAGQRFALGLFKTTTVSMRSSSSAGAAGNRLSGRSRFYKEVGIQSLAAAPWESIDKPSSSSTASNDESDTIASPISAGVDGTQSATGVHHIPKSDETSSSLEQMLRPRLPGLKPAEPKKTNDNDINSNKNPWYGITLDGRKVSTPMGKTLAVPSESLAYMIAAEWDSQTKELQPSNMPLMTLACTALDQVAYHPQFYRDAALQYLPTDTVRA